MATKFTHLQTSYDNPCFAYVNIHNYHNGTRNGTLRNSAIWLFSHGQLDVCSWIKNYIILFRKHLSVANYLNSTHLRGKECKFSNLAAIRLDQKLNEEFILKCKWQDFFEYFPEVFRGFLRSIWEEYLAWICLKCFVWWFRKVFV